MSAAAKPTGRTLVKRSSPRETRRRSVKILWLFSRQRRERERTSPPRRYAFTSSYPRRGRVLRADIERRLRQHYIPYTTVRRHSGSCGKTLRERCLSVFRSNVSSSSPSFPIPLLRSSLSCLPYLYSFLLYRDITAFIRAYHYRSSLSLCLFPFSVSRCNVVTHVRSESDNRLYRDYTRHRTAKLHAYATTVQI